MATCCTNVTLETEVDCEEELCGEKICRFERYFAELFSRTDSLLDLINGNGIRFKIAFTADQGLASTLQTTLANSFLNESQDISLFGGDNNYYTGQALTIESNWAQFDGLVTAGTAYPALGNHDMDIGGVTPWSPQTDKFNYLSNNQRYYHNYFEQGSLDLFVLNSGWNSATATVEPSGNTLGSAQYQWFLNELGASCGKWKIVMFHHPYVSGTSNAVNTQRVNPAMDWGYEALGIDLVLNGHTHTAQHLRHTGLNILDVSNGVMPLRAMSGSGTIYGSGAAETELVWSYAAPGFTGDRHYATIDIVGNAMVVSVKLASNSAVVYSFPIIK